MAIAAGLKGDWIIEIIPYLKLYRIRWICIMLNQIFHFSSKGKDIDYIFNKIFDYKEKSSDYIDAAITNIENKYLKNNLF